MKLGGVFLIQNLWKEAEVRIIEVENRKTRAKLTIAAFNRKF